MAGSQAVVQFLIEYAEKGGNLPDKVKRDLDRMAQSGHESRSALDKLGDAFGRLEKREPALVVRELRTAIVDMGASAIGATGPLGRLAVSLGTLGTGGAIGIAAVGGLAAITAGFAAVVEQADKLDANLLKINAGFASLVGGRAQQFAQLAELRMKAEDLQRPGLLEAALTPRPGQIGLPFAGTIAGNLRTARVAELRTVEAQINEVERQLGKSRDEIINRHAPNLREVGTEWRSIAGELKSFADHASDVTVRINTQNLSLKEQAQAVRDLDLAYAQLAARLGIPSGRAAPQLPAGATRPFPGLRGPAPQFATYDAGYTPEGNKALEESASSGNTAAILAALLGVAGGARGGAGGAISGLGGLASTLGGLKNKAGAKILPSFLGPLGTALSFGGGLLSLFGGSSQPHVVISRLEEQAIQDMKRVMQTPQNVSVNVVSAGDIRNTKQALARAEGLDTVSRLPG